MKDIRKNLSSSFVTLTNHQSQRLIATLQVNLLGQISYRNHKKTQQEVLAVFLYYLYNI